MSGVDLEPGLPPIVEADETRRTALDAWDSAEADHPTDRCIHRLFEAQVERAPDAVAVVHEETRLTYRELNERANRLARHLARLGVGPETRVGICLERGPTLVPALLAVLKAGGAYVPLDPEYPAERLALMLADAGAAVVVTEARLRGLVAEPAGVRVVALDSAADEIAQESPDNPEGGAGAGNLAYVVFTSGSTGRPKGVGVPHAALANHTAWMQRAFPLGPADRVLQKTPFAFDAAAWEFWSPLAAGATLVMARPGGHRDAGYLAETLERFGITVLQVVPSLLRALAEVPELDAAATTLARLFCGGEPLPAPLCAALSARLDARIVNLYGPTEACIDATFHPYAGEAAGTVPIGHPVDGAEAFVLDEAGAPAAEGELYLGGAGLARGYLNAPSATAARFVPSPFRGVGARLYRTGDRVRVGPDGALAFLGRMDFQVKVRGQRVEPGEVEAVLAAHADVRACVVVAREDAPGMARLVAYVVAREGAPAPGAAELRRYARERLPEHMVPSFVVALPELPLTPNGKVDRDALPAPAAALPQRERPYRAPGTEVEARLVEIWGEVLGLAGVGVDDDLFDLGGHSLAVTQVASRIREALGAALPLGAVFGARTVAELAAAVEEARAGGARGPARTAVLARAPHLARVPLAFGQERVWFLVQLAPDNRAYHFQATLTFRGVLDAGALARSLTEIVRRHEIFRTSFPAEHGIPYQRVHPPFEVELPLIDLSGLPPEARPEAEARALREAMAQRFDLARLPMVRWYLIRRAANEHVLLHVEHHIVHDGWSFNVFLRELLALYRAYAAGRPSPLPEPRLQFADFACAQRAWLESDEAAAQLRFWTQRLASAPAPPVLELPFDRPRLAEQRYRGDAPRYELPAALYQKVRAVSRAHGVTLFGAMLAAYQALMARWSGQMRLSMGTAIANRRLGETEGLMGMFVNNLVLRPDLSDDPTFGELMRRAADEMLEGAENQELPFEAVVDALRPDRSLSHNPLYQGMFSFHDSPIPELRLPGMEVELLSGLANGSAKFDMNVVAIPRAEQRVGQGRAGDADSIEVVWEYNSDLFDAATIDAMVRQYTTLLEAGVDAPDTPVSRLPLLSDEEAAATAAAGRPTRAFPVGERIHARFERVAAERPSAPAVTFEGITTTYGELNARANRLAHRLIALGVGPETRVGVALERSAELVAAILAVLKAGGGYVPIDPAYPAERIAYVLEDAGAPVLVAARDLAARLPALDGAALCVDADAEAIAREPAENPVVPAPAESLAYVIYTSGSTGRPKGVQVTHANVVRLFDATADRLGLGPSDVWTLFHSAAFDFSVWEIWGALLHGGRLVVVPFHLSRDAAAFRALLAGEGVTVLSQTPSAFRALDAADAGEPDPLERLRLVVFGGEALRYESLRGWLDRYGLQRPRLVNMYGITETTVHVTWHVVTGRELREPRLGSGVGTPLPDLGAYVLDPAGRPCPPSVPGEVYVGGAGVARGYLGRPALTAERFVPDPFSGEAGARLYRSGDRARWTAEGTLEYLGRIDQQVKLRGFRIEPGEVERALLAEPSVAAAAVVVHGEDDEAGLVAYVVPAGDGVHAPALRDALRRRLPEYMVPGAIVAVDRIPLTANGKVDRRALPAPDAAGAAAAGTYVAPATPVEEVLAAIWAQVLRVDRVGTAEGFFELGGHSLLATRVVSRVREALGVEVPLRDLFEGSTVAELAARVEALRRAGAPPLPPVARLGRDRAPLSFAQERLWFLDRLEPGSALYNLRVPLRLEGALNVAALEHALGEVVRRHDVLRTTFAEVDGTPVQVVAPFAGFTLPVEEVPGGDAAAREAEALRRASAEGARPFDLERGPLFRALLLQMDPDDHLLLLWMHHAVGDGWSTGVLLRELSGLYAAYRDGGESPLPDLPVQYGDYAAWQREQLGGSVQAREVAFWRERLAGAPALLELPTDRPRPAVQTHRGAREPVVVAAAAREAIEGLARREGVTPYMVVLGAFQLLLSRYAGTDDVVVGSPVAGRARAEVEPLIGLFVNTLVMRTGLSGDPTFRELLGRVRETTLAAYEHQDVPYERLVEVLRPARSLSHEALFQVMFQLRHLDGPPGALPGVRMERMALEIPTAKFDLALELAPDPSGELRGTMEYATDLFDRSTISRTLGHFARVLEQVAADADLRLSGVELMGADERRQVVEAWNPAGADVPAPHGIARLFEARAALAPGAAAVVCGDRSLTYGELDERANRLARYLRRRGVGVESRVGICLERGLEMVVALLAVLKAGGAYVPLDPAYPAERLEGMLADAGVEVVVSQAALLDRLPHGRKLVVLERVRDAVAAEEASDPGVEISGDHLCYVIYTSGSTGRPKGTEVPHRAIPGFFPAVDPAGPGPHTATLQYASASWDVLTLELWPPLLSGGTCVLYDGATPTPEQLGEAVRRHGVNTLWLTATYFNLLVDTAPGALAGVRRAMVGGEAVSAAHVRAAQRLHPSLRIVNGYGPSECTVFSSAHEVEALSDEDVSIPIGRPVGDRRVYVLDAALRPVPVGVPGELYVGGPAVPRGYAGQPRLTAERLVPDPFAPAPGARLYRTGDRVRWRADGTLDFLGRLDEQVKIRGFRIEPGEVETVLSAHPAVREARVVVREDEPGEKRLVAYVVGEIDAEGLRAHLRGILPEYLVPAALVTLDSLPLTPNGKLDVKALPAPDLASAEEYVAPRTPMEEVLAGFWADALRLERVGVTQNFFALGGHSLLATRVVSRIRAEVAVEVPLRALFEGPTVAELADRVEALRSAGTSVLPPIVPLSRERAVPNPVPQQRL